MKQPVALIIRDGWGISPQGQAAAEKEGNAPLLAKLPFHEHLYATYPQSRLSASGLDVGLPEGQMGNSEVGHLNLGAGRVVYQDLTRINLDIKEGKFSSNPELVKLLTHLRDTGKTLHLWGLLSDGGVHSHINHLFALLAAAREQGLTKVLVHAFTDGRDTAPQGGAGYLTELIAKIKELGVGTLATLVGRYYAMDRDQRWDRTSLAWNLLFNGTGTYAEDPVAHVKSCYANGKTDEFLPATVFIKEPRPLVVDGDGILFFNFRSDRARQLSRALLSKEWPHFDRSYHPSVKYVTMTEYDATYGVPILYSPQSMHDLLGEVVARSGKHQLRMAETEKYPHVTYFFNGGNETPNPEEDREVIPSPKVATYDLQPSMNAPQLTDAVIKRLETGEYDLLILNFANPDMVGHTGVLAAAIEAVETIDACLKRVVEKILSMGGKALITADHGNCERMIAADGSPHTAHTTNLVQFIYVAADASRAKLEDGILADVAPTLLYLLGVEKPSDMTGHSLVTIS
ncbi:MAG TPA: 2,3-bisphosphoglycerate-independent phosphoglycerate mutase [Candidatus Methylacidiphilales bacterium]|nr:2,3-bisphosphoglycerate-independent phosphoglycerate mutase [Candidatus Methylacidiphilales bacterium]